MTVRRLRGCLKTRGLAGERRTERGEDAGPEGIAALVRGSEDEASAMVRRRQTGAGVLRQARRGVAVIALIAGLAGCGQGTKRDLSLEQLPLVPGAKIATQVKQCDRGA